MIYKKTKNFNTLHGLIKNLGGQYNALMISFQNLYDTFSVVSGFTELLKHEIETQKEKQKILQKELKEAYGEISAMKIKEHGNNDSDKLLFNDLDGRLKRQRDELASLQDISWVSQEKMKGRGSSENKVPDLKSNLVIPSEVRNIPRENGNDSSGKDVTVNSINKNSVVNKSQTTNVMPGTRNDDATRRETRMGRL